MQSYRRKCRKFRFVNSAPAEQGARTAAGVFASNVRHLFLHRLSGVFEPRRRFTLTGGEFFAEPQRGIRRLRTAGVSRRPPRGMERHRGYVRALQEYGVLYDPDRIIWFHTEDRAVKPFARLRAMAASGIKFDSVVCYNDQIAIKTIQTLSQLGIRVSEDVSVTGYDNSFLAENYQVGLTTIAHPHERLGEIAAKLLLDLMQEKTLSIADRQIVIEPELIERESCKPR